MIVRAKGSTVCEVFAQRGITEANARLIAAAPNMLAVLKLVVEYANTPQGKLDPRCPEFDRDLFDKFKLIWADVGAVIASAE